MNKTLTYKDHSARVIITDPADHQEKNWVEGNWYEPNLLDDLYNMSNPTYNFYDIGASIGNHSVFASVICGMNVVAFEPHRRSFRQLTENLFINGITAIPLPILLSSGAKRYNPEHPPDNNVGMNRYVPSSGSGSVSQSSALDDWVGVLPPPDIIKIDVEGMEKEVLIGAAKTLELSRPILYIEIIGDTHEIDVYLSRFGYERTAVFNHTPTYRYEAE